MTVVVEEVKTEITGTQNEDKIFGDIYGTVIRGKEGEDIIIENYGKNIEIYGGDGSDYIQTYAGVTNSFIYGDNDNDYINCQGSFNTIYGGNGEDNITAGQYSTVYGQEDDDTISIGAYSTAYGGNGEDKINAGTHCVVHGGNGKDAINLIQGIAYGDDGDDEITISDSIGSIIYGGKGNDTLTGAQYMYGGEGDDEIWVHGGSAVVNGGSGSNKINIGAEATDYLQGNIVTIENGGGEDTLIYNNIFDSSQLKYCANGYDLIIKTYNNLPQYADYYNYVTIKDYIKNNGDVSLKSIKYNNETHILKEEINISNLTQIKFLPQVELGEEKVNITGTDNSDIIYDGIKNNTIKAGAGSDRIYASYGSNTIYGEDGDDYIETFSENNTIYGGDGDDTIKTDNGTVYGGEGNDLIIGGNNKIDGGEGNNTINATSGMNTILNGKGVDTLLFENVGRLSDLAFTKDGNDLIIATRCPEQKNTYTRIKDYIKNKGNVSTKYIQFKNSQYQLIYKLTDIINLGSTSNTNVSSNDNNNTDNTTPIIQGTSENETFKGTKGDDFYEFKQGSGQDIVYSGKGNDTLIFKEIDVDNINFTKSANGKDLIINYTDNDSVTIKDFIKNKGKSSVKSMQDSENSWMKNLNEENIVIKINQLGNDFPQKIYGTCFVDEIKGSDSDDIIKAGKNSDIIIANKGNDKIYGEYGSNNIIFNLNDGHDTVYSGKGSDTLIFKNIAIDNENVDFTKLGNHLVIKYSDTDSVTVYNYFKGKSTSSVKTLVFGEKTYDLERMGSDIKIQNISNPSEYTIYNTSVKLGDTTAVDNIKVSGVKNQSNIIYGGNNNDKLYGNNLDDFLYGGKGDDYLSGGKGRDTLVAGSGSNKLYGGDGNDTYIIDDLSSRNFIDDSAKKAYETWSDALIVKYDDAVFDITHTEDVTLLFNVELKAYKVGKKSYIYSNEIKSTGSSLFLLKDATNGFQSSGGIEMSKFFGKVYDSNITTAAGAIENISIVTKDIEGNETNHWMSSWQLSQVAQNVADWLFQSNSYGSVNEVFNKPNNEEDISSLIKVFQEVDWYITY